MNQLCKTIYEKLEKGLGALTHTGEEVFLHDELIYVTKGSKIVPRRKGYVYSYIFYTLKRPGQYLYSYDYQKEEQWLSREERYDSSEVVKTDTTFDDSNLPEDKEGYIKITIKNLKSVSNSVGLEDFLEIHSPDGITGRKGWKAAEEESKNRHVKQFLERQDVQAEIGNTIEKVLNKASGSRKLIFTLLSDTHYVLNGNWEMTAATMEAVNKAVHPYGIIHLGDFTDGILDKEICREYSYRVLDRIQGWGYPAYIVLGNHDANYFGKNPYILNEEEQREMYLEKIIESESVSRDSKLWYRMNVDDFHLQLFMLHSYDNDEQLRYGFPLEEIDWIKEELENISENDRILICSHDAPLSDLDYWAKEIRNGEILCDILDDWNKAHGNRIIGFLHGHTHADFIYQGRSFPIISVGCSKIEYFEDKKPEGAICPVRMEGEVSQELWDTLILDCESGDMDFIRFGAGVDRHIDGKLAEESSDTVLPRMTQTLPQIWAHRGASGGAPENTLDAFALAVELKADGVELDVQLTRDRKLVVIHDERIDRTSDGTGYVGAMTLEELRKYNYNKTHPEFQHCDIPTLEDVFKLLKPTELRINIELKTGINFYPGIELAVIQLVERYGLENRVIYSSFNHESIKKVKGLRPEAECGFLYSSGIADAVSYAVAHHVEALHPAAFNMKYPGFVEACKERGIKIHTWTVNSVNEIEQMRQYGVDALITNYPERARQVYYGEDLGI